MASAGMAKTSFWQKEGMISFYIFLPTVLDSREFFCILQLLTTKMQGCILLNGLNANYYTTGDRI